MKLLMMRVCNMDPFLLTASHRKEEGALKTNQYLRKKTYSDLNPKTKSFMSLCPEADFNVIK